jgi:hypothetical protein
MDSVSEWLWSPTTRYGEIERRDEVEPVDAEQRRVGSSGRPARLADVGDEGREMVEVSKEREWIEASESDTAQVSASKRRRYGESLTVWQRSCVPSGGHAAGFNPPVPHRPTWACPEPDVGVWACPERTTWWFGVRAAAIGMVPSIAIGDGSHR